jgi:hypothetical protein
MSTVRKPSVGASERPIAEREIEPPVPNMVAAEILGVSAGTLSRWTARRLVPLIKSPPGESLAGKGRVLYLVSAPLALREECQREGPETREQVRQMIDEMGSPDSRRGSPGR